MKRFLGVLFLSMILSHTAMAVTTIPWTKEGCESVKGTWITAKSATDAGCDTAHCNGKNFCRGRVRMNWWSALIWCQSIGHRMPDLETACPNALSSGAYCANLYGPNNEDVWTSTPIDANYVYKLGHGGREPQGWIKDAQQGVICSE